MTSAPKAFVAGWPIAHSRSPIIHNHWLKTYGIKGHYVIEAVSPEDFVEFLGSIRERGFVGGNVTIPHKELAFDRVDVCDDVAKILRAVNTVWLENDTLHGANTDAHGFAANLDDRAAGWDNKAADEAALIIGAGGASRAVIHVLQQRGYARIFLVNRTVEKARALAGLFGRPVEARGWGEISLLVPEVGCIVNTTALGMQGNQELDIDLETARDGALVTDIVYTPLDTGLLRAARRRGLKSVDGLGMLLHQAVPGFQQWFGVRPKVTLELRQALLADLGVTS